MILIKIIICDSRSSLASINFYNRLFLLVVFLSIFFNFIKTTVSTFSSTFLSLISRVLNGQGHNLRIAYSNYMSMNIRERGGGRGVRPLR